MEGTANSWVEVGESQHKILQKKIPQNLHEIEKKKQQKCIRFHTDPSRIHSHEYCNSTSARSLLLQYSEYGN